MRTIAIPRKKLVRTALAVVAVVGLAIVATDVVGRLGQATAAQTGVEAAAAGAIGEALRLDHEEGQEAWAGRVKPLCTDAGWAFWNLVAVQTWPKVMEQKYAVTGVEVLDTNVVEETGENVTVSVTLELTYVQDGEVASEEKVYPVVMVEQHGAWLMDMPPKE